MKIVVYHGYYGCDTGCCGHYLQVRTDDVAFDQMEVVFGDDGFVFSPQLAEPFREFAENLVREKYGEDHVKDLDWDNCYIVDGDF